MFYLETNGLMLLYLLHLFYHIYYTMNFIIKNGTLRVSFSFIIVIIHNNFLKFN